MTSDAKEYYNETGSYNARLIQVMRQHALIDPEEEDEIKDYLHTTSIF
ncbi:hypothetical protein JW711_04230 [Candidatus Woesearchaeota archaeon]|nr:hypothetical protein [Candidatus Woesearchaeota archaeon]